MGKFNYIVSIFQERYCLNIKDYSKADFHGLNHHFSFASIPSYLIVVI